MAVSGGTVGCQNGTRDRPECCSQAGWRSVVAMVVVLSREPKAFGPYAYAYSPLADEAIDFGTTIIVQLTRQKHKLTQTLTLTTTKPRKAAWTIEHVSSYGHLRT